MTIVTQLWPFHFYYVKINLQIFLHRGANMSKIKNYSPLRYPGGKRKLTAYVEQLIDENKLTNITYIEPYAGGAAIALNLLINEYVKKIVLNDLDKSIYAFWYSVINYTNELCNLIENVEITIEEWNKQKSIQANKSSESLLNLGFSTLFLNRTNRSGILKGGVIGGLNQDGNYKIDCRFNKKVIIEKIKLISKYKNKIKLHNLDAIEFINTVVIKSRTTNFILLDPPYYKKGASLYNNFYSHDDHLALQKKISALRRHYWILTYDNIPEIAEMYSKFRAVNYSINYTAQNKYSGSELLIYSKNVIIPKDVDKLP